MLTTSGNARNPLSKVTRWAVLAFVAGILPGAATVAQEREAERKIARARERVHHLARVAEALQDLDRPEMAEALRHEAHELEVRLGRHVAELERAHAERDELGEIIEKLEHGMVALRALGRHDALEMLERIADEVREERAARKQRRGGEGEREIALRQLKIMRYAVEALAEAGKPDAADIVERAIRAREVTLEGRRDEEAAHIRETAPNRGQLAEFLGLAAELLQHARRTERATVVGRLARELAQRHGRQQHGGEERAIAMQQIEHMQLALHALLEADRGEAAELLEHAIHARKLALKGRRDEEAAHIRETAPGRDQVAELLTLAHRIYDEMGHERKAEVVGRLAREFMPERAQRRGGDSDAVMARIERLEGRLEELVDALEHLSAQVRELRRGHD